MYNYQRQLIMQPELNSEFFYLISNQWTVVGFSDCVFVDSMLADDLKLSSDEDDTQRVGSHRLVDYLCLSGFDLSGTRFKR